MPSRMSFLTGRYCSSLNIGDNGVPFPKNRAKLINEYLKPYGYDTSYIGKIHFLPHANRDHRKPYEDYGYNTFIISDEPGCYNDPYVKWVENQDPNMVPKIRTILPPAARKYNQKNYYNKEGNTHQPYYFEGDEKYTHTNFVTSEVCRYLNGINENNLFFLVAGYYAPHPPLNPPKKYVDLYNFDDMKLPKVGKYEKYDFLKNINDEKWKEIRAFYMAMVSMVDEGVGKIVNKLKEKNILEDTIIIFTSDHGEYLGDYGRVQKGMPGHDVISKVPCIISYPKKIKKDMLIKELVEAVDIVPTILDYCGVQIPDEIEGKSLKPLIEGKIDKHKDTILIERFVPNGLKETTIRTKNYKYYCNSNGEEILFDLKKDKFELENVVKKNEYKEILSIMRKKMIIKMQNAAYKSFEQVAEY
ncbi:MAG: sulfatase [Fusobacteriales bacterium]|jgi:arylsulfatase A-like enzyme|nr:sulfatase [Fusobacteriales bacterium]